MLSNLAIISYLTSWLWMPDLTPMWSFSEDLQDTVSIAC